MNTNWMVVTSDAASWSFARAEVGKAMKVVGEYELAPGVWLVEGDSTFAQVAVLWRERSPIFVRHIQPVTRVLSLAGDPADPESVAQRLAADGQALEAMDATMPFSVQTRILCDVPYKPFAMNEPLAASFARSSGAPVDVRAPRQVVSVAVVQPLREFEQRARRGGLFPRGEHTERASALALIGVSPVEDNLSDWAGGMHRFAREAEQVSRSEFKLLEALDLFKVILPERGVALDLGASPGGWTRILRQRGQYVTAVDPGELDPRVAADAGVRHKRMTAEEYLRGEPDRFDVLVNDMRMDARESARLMNAYAGCLYAHGVAIMTLKLPEDGSRAILDEALGLLGRAYKIIAARQLFHNRSEVTVYLRKNGSERR